jgi:hypothetical protein
MRLYIDSDNALTWTQLRDELTGQAVTDAIVTAKVWSDDDPQTVLATATLAHQSDGEYLGVLESGDTSALVPATRYTLELVAQSGNAKVVKRIACSATYAGAND